MEPAELETVQGPVAEYLFSMGSKPKPANFSSRTGSAEQVSHPSTKWWYSGIGESTRLTFNHFAKRWRVQLLADVRDVFALIWFAVVRQFPKCWTSWQPTETYSAKRHRFGPFSAGTMRTPA